MAGPERSCPREVACGRTGHVVGGLRVSRIRDPGRGQPSFPKGGKGLALEAGTVVRALFITIDSKV